eukprot:2953144-Prymnesium_polylepis.1
MLGALLLSALAFSFAPCVSSLPQLDWCGQQGVLPVLFSDFSFWGVLVMSTLLVLTPRFLKKAFAAFVE